MPVNFQRLKRGPWAVTQITADAIIESAEHWARHRRDPGLQGPPEYHFEGNLVEVRNDSSYPMPRFSVAGLAGPLITPANNLQEFQNFPRFSVRTPIVPGDSGRFCVLVEPLAVGAIGLAMVSGVVACQVYRTAGDTAPLFADVVDGQLGYLQRSSSGASVLWCDELPTGYTSGPVWALVRLPESTSPLPTQLTLSDVINSSTHIGSNKYTVNNPGGCAWAYLSGLALDAAGIQLLTPSAWTDPSIQVLQGGLWLATVRSQFQVGAYSGGGTDPWLMTVAGSPLVASCPSLGMLAAFDGRRPNGTLSGGVWTPSSGYGGWGSNVAAPIQACEIASIPTGADGNSYGIYPFEGSQLYDCPANTQFRITLGGSAPIDLRNEEITYGDSSGLQAFVRLQRLGPSQIGYF